VTPVPEPVAAVARVMRGFNHDWRLCGGWAIDAWLGRQTRDHHDVDIAVFEEEQRALFEHLAGFELIAHRSDISDDSTDPWDGRRIDPPAHVHVRSEGFELEVLLDERENSDWVFSRNPRITLPLERCSVQSDWGFAIASPEVLLFYKATAYVGVEEGYPRAPDELDFLALLPHATGDSRLWLREAIRQLYPDHPWLPVLSE
jgi:hypothetical protein